MQDIAIGHCLGEILTSKGALVFDPGMLYV